MREVGVESLPFYETALTNACKFAPPPYGKRAYGDTYRSIAVNPHWMAESLINSAEREGDGATRLWNLAASTSEDLYRKQVKRHSIDESHHSAWYLRLLDLTFPGQ